MLELHVTPSQAKSIFKQLVAVYAVIWSSSHWFDRTEFRVSVYVQ